LLSDCGKQQEYACWYGRGRRWTTSIGTQAVVTVVMSADHVAGGNGYAGTAKNPWKRLMAPFCTVPAAGGTAERATVRQQRKICRYTNQPSELMVFV
jgi:hypothetical protein